MSEYTPVTDAVRDRSDGHLEAVEALERSHADLLAACVFGGTPLLHNAGHILCEFAKGRPSEETLMAMGNALKKKCEMEAAATAKARGTEGGAA